MSAAVRPHYCTDPDVTWGRGRGCPLVVHYWVLGGFAIGAQLASIPRYDDSANGRLGGVCAHCWQVTGGWRGGVLKIARRIWEVGVAGSPVIGRRRGRSQQYCGGLDCGLPLVAFVKGSLHYRTVVCPVRRSVCDIGVLWQNGWMDQDATWLAQATLC